MDNRESKKIRGLLERLLAARARRDREVRFSEAWTAADTDMHAIERAIFRVSADDDDDDRPTPIHAHGRVPPARYETERAG
jgi:hypothetical protein